LGAPFALFGRRQGLSGALDEAPTNTPIEPADLSVKIRSSALLSQVPINKYTQATFPRTCSKADYPERYQQVQWKPIATKCAFNVEYRAQEEGPIVYFRLSFSQEQRPEPQRNTSDLFFVTLRGASAHTEKCNISSPLCLKKQRMMLRSNPPVTFDTVLNNYIAASNDEVLLLNVCSAGAHVYYASANVSYVGSAPSLRLGIRHIYQNYFLQDPRPDDNNIVEPPSTASAEDDCASDANFLVSDAARTSSGGGHPQLQRPCKYDKGPVPGHWDGHQWMPHGCQLHVPRGRALTSCLAEKKVCIVGDSHARRMAIGLNLQQARAELGNATFERLFTEVPEWGYAAFEDAMCEASKGHTADRWPEEERAALERIDFKFQFFSNVWGTTAAPAHTGWDYNGNKVVIVNCTGSTCGSLGGLSRAFEECDLSPLMTKERCTDILVGFGHWHLQNKCDGPTSFADFAQRAHSVFEVWNGTASAQRPNLYWLTVPGHNLQTKYHGPGCAQRVASPGWKGNCKSSCSQRGKLNHATSPYISAYNAIAFDIMRRYGTIQLVDLFQLTHSREQQSFDGNHYSYMPFVEAYANSMLHSLCQ
jgi:hypothetical protein